MSENKMPQAFESFAQARKDGFVAVKNLKDGGKKVVGTFCTYTPVELMLAAGSVPVSICAFSDETIPEAERDLPRNLCPLVKSSYGFAITEKCPYTYFADLLVGETTCDAKKKMYELLGDIKPMHVMQLPQTQHGEAANALWYSEVVRLKERLEQDFGAQITTEGLEQAIAIKNEERRLIREFYELGKLNPPAVSGADQLKVLYGSQFKFDPVVRSAELREIIEGLKGAYERGERPVPATAKRILITGCPLAGVTEKVITAVEQSGGAVVAYENCVGVKAAERLVAEHSADPLRAIAERYLQIGCSVMTPDNERYRLLSQLVEEYRVDGVVEMTLQACHTYSVETAQIRRLTQQLGVPFMSIETDYSTSDVAQIKTRVAAFIEMLS